MTKMIRIILYNTKVKRDTVHTIIIIIIAMHYACMYTSKSQRAAKHTRTCTVAYCTYLNNN